jgi:hypothetical protein
VVLLKKLIIIKGSLLLESHIESILEKGRQNERINQRGKKVGVTLQLSSLWLLGTGSSRHLCVISEQVAAR